jgi:hypothetical protein
MPRGEIGEAKSSVGAAARQTRFGQVEDIGKDIALAAFRQGQPGGDPQERSAGLLADIARNIKIIVDWLPNPDAIKQGAREGIKAGAGAAVGAAEASGFGLPNFLADALRGAIRAW